MLGAGFSAPLGLPVVKDFFTRAKDLYFTDTERYRYFREVFQRIDELARVKNYFTSDLLDIEEVLSILDIDGDFGRGVRRSKLSSLIVDVIAGYTPALSAPQRPAPANWAAGAFGGSRLASEYGYFVAGICRFALAKEARKEGAYFICCAEADPKCHYDIVTLNYDCALENIWKHATAHYEIRGAKGFTNDPDEKEGRATLCKLHGSVDTGVVIPPTSRKLIGRKIKPAWDAAFSVLSRANHLRIFGYSLPPTDTYVRYLLKAAIARAEHLKSIHVLCLDNAQAEVESRYRDFINFKYFAFQNENVQQYLRGVFEHAALNQMGTAHTPGTLEAAHAMFFGHP